MASAYRDRLLPRLKSRVGIPNRESPTREEFLEVLREGTVDEVGMALHDTNEGAPSASRQLLERVSYADADVRNGGFRQRLDNDAPSIAALVNDLERLGLAEHAAIVREARRRYRGRGHDAALFRDLDERWYAAAAQLRLEETLRAFASTNAEALLPEPQFLRR